MKIRVHWGRVAATLALTAALIAMGAWALSLVPPAADPEDSGSQTFGPIVNED